MDIFLLWPRNKCEFFFHLSQFPIIWIESIYLTKLRSLFIAGCNVSYCQSWRKRTSRQVSESFAPFYFILCILVRAQVCRWFKIKSDGPSPLLSRSDLISIGNIHDPKSRERHGRLDAESTPMQILENEAAAFGDVW